MNTDGGGTPVPAAAEDDELPPPAPSVLGALRAGAVGIVTSSWRVVPLNVVFGAGLVAALFAWLWVGLLPAVPVLVLLAVPVSAMFRVGAQAARGRDASLVDALRPFRARPIGILAAALAFLVTTLVLATNLLLGLAAGGALEWLVAAAAAWGLAATLAFGFAFWPLAVDPWREDVPLRRRARLAGLLLLARPVALLALTAILVAVLVFTALAAAAVLLTLSAGFCALAASRYVLPAADSLEERLDPTRGRGGAATTDSPG